MGLDYKLIIIAAIAQFVLGGLWHSSFMFGKWWMEIMEITNFSKEEIRKLQKEMAPFYGLQFLLTVLFTFALAMFIHYLKLADVGFHSYGVAGWIWLGFVAPVQVAGVIWGNTKRKYWVKQIFLITGYQLASLMLAAFILNSI